ncbi:MAG: hypothetical protein KQA31_02290 [Candidatus Aenigmarchaeota archaeon]|nr:hypothetical protein [Candidatus Aenigmarchaeota archaeon]
MKKNKIILIFIIVFFSTFISISLIKARVVDCYTSSDCGDTYCYYCFEYHCYSYNRCGDGKCNCGETQNSCPGDCGSSGGGSTTTPGGGITTTTYCICSATDQCSPPGRYFVGTGCGSSQCSPCDICVCTGWTPAGCGKYGCDPSLMAYTRTCYTGSCASVECRPDSACGTNPSDCEWERTGCCIGDVTSKWDYICKGDNKPKYSKCTDACQSSRSCSPWQSFGQGDCPDGYEKQKRKCCGASGCVVEEKCAAVVTQPGKTPTAKPPKQTTPPNNQPPIGKHELINCSETSGWACDYDNPSSSLKILFYLDGKRGSGGTLIGSTIANKNSSIDVFRACNNTSNHGFYFPIPNSTKDDKKHKLYVYAVGDKNEVKLLNNTPLDFQCKKILSISASILKEICYNITDKNKMRCEARNETLTFIKGEKVIIDGYVYSGSNLISKANVNITIRNFTLQEKFRSNTTTNNKGKFSFNYTINSDYGNWLVELTAQKSGYEDAILYLVFNVADCFEDNDCPVYAYCSSDLKCIDLRPYAKGCNYFDFCKNGTVPGTEILIGIPDKKLSNTGAKCIYGIHCYSQTMSEEEMWPLCNDNNYANHSLIINCNSIGSFK